MTNAIRIGLVVAFVNSFLMLFFVVDPYTRANFYVSIAVLTFAICAFGIPLLAAAANAKNRGHYLFLGLIALMIFGPATLVIAANFESLNMFQLILPITAGIVVFLFTFVSPSKK